MFYSSFIYVLVAWLLTLESMNEYFGKTWAAELEHTKGNSYNKKKRHEIIYNKDITNDVIDIARIEASRRDLLKHYLKSQKPNMLIKGSINKMKKPYKSSDKNKRKSNMRRKKHRILIIKNILKDHLSKRAKSLEHINDYDKVNDYGSNENLDSKPVNHLHDTAEEISLPSVNNKVINRMKKIQILQGNIIRNEMASEKLKHDLKKSEEKSITKKNIQKKESYEIKSDERKSNEVKDSRESENHSKLYISNSDEEKEVKSLQKETDSKEVKKQKNKERHLSKITNTIEKIRTTKQTQLPFKHGTMWGNVKQKRFVNKKLRQTTPKSNKITNKIQRLEIEDNDEYVNIDDIRMAHTHSTKDRDNMPHRFDIQSNQEKSEETDVLEENDYPTKSTNTKVAHHTKFAQTNPKTRYSIENHIHDSEENIKPINREVNNDDNENKSKDTKGANPRTSTLTSKPDKSYSITNLITTLQPLRMIKTEKPVKGFNKNPEFSKKDVYDYLRKKKRKIRINFQKKYST